MPLVELDPPAGPAGPEEDPLAAPTGYRVVVAGFDPEASAGILATFQTAGAFCRTCMGTPLDPAVRSCDLVVAWLAGIEDQAALGSVTAPVIAVVSPFSAANYLPWMRESAIDFVFYPCAEMEILTRAAMAIYRRRAHPGRSPDEKFRILLADDDPSITALLKATIDSDRMMCQCARNGIEAMKIAREWKPDLAVLDVNMPGMDGYQTLAALRRGDKQIPVLLLTGCDQESEVMKGFKLGAADYVVKPFNPVEVLMRIKRFVT